MAMRQTLFNLRKRQYGQREAHKVGKVFDIIVKGGAAFWDGKTPVQCPFILDTPKWRAWMIGWDQAFARRLQ